MTKKILVTGGTGTIGSGLVNELTSRGYDVYSVDLAHDLNQIGFSLRTDMPTPKYARCDVGEYRQLERIFDTWGPFDYVYHAAAEFGRWNGEDYYEQLWQSNAIGTKNIVRLQEKHKFRLIHFSSSEVYGDWPDVMVENVMDKYEIKQMNDYAMTKWVNEMQVKNSAIHYNTESVIIRIFNTYGPGEYYSPYRSVNCRFIYCALAGIPWLVYRGYTRTSTFLADSVRTIANICENFKPGETYNIGGDQYHTVEEFSDIVLKVTGADPGLVIYKEEEVLTTRHKKVDITKALTDLNHKTTTTLEEGIKQTVEWMRSVYKFK
ncbi:MAG TPA: NAD(P)-dependent oxidoreductase [Bacteroidia bacterium]|nr:NAD(P)-dependent oxidoreductase [Bacteroidia bacterium]